MTFVDFSQVDEGDNKSTGFRGHEPRALDAKLRGLVREKDE